MSRALRVAVVGSGPSGFYAAEALMKQKDLPVEVDMLERLPTPYGLVRGGVAPDHQKIKSVTSVYEKVAASPGFRFFGNLRVGQDLPAAELSRFYDAVVYAVGNESDKHLGVPGEGLPGSHAATEFVGWYNGHPDHRHRSFDLSCERAAVIGVGNVAMDVTRILARDPAELAPTDIAGYALDALRGSRVREVLLIGRRGPAQAAFSPAEIEEIAELSSADLVVEAAPEPVSEEDPKVRKILAFLAEQAKKGEGSLARKVRLRFLLSPVELIAEKGRVGALKLEKNELYADAKGGVQARGTGRFETVPVGLVLRSVGYYGVPIAGVPFDEKLGRIPNAGGRVTGLERAYVVGWAKRGPTGLIGTNRADSVATIAALVEDFKGKALAASPERTAAAAEARLRAAKGALVTFADWKRLDSLELEGGRKAGKVREKFTRVEDMLSALRKGSGA